VSGSGNVAQYAALKLLEYNAVVLTMSDSTGYVYEPNGFTREQIEQVRLTQGGNGCVCCGYVGGRGCGGWQIKCVSAGVWGCGGGGGGTGRGESSSCGSGWVWRGCDWDAGI